METKLRRNFCILICVIVTICAMPAMASANKVNINTAPKEELITLKHVGDVIADRIIKFRENTPFTKIEDFMQVKGIGVKVFDANKDKISVTD